MFQKLTPSFNIAKNVKLPVKRLLATQANVKHDFVENDLVFNEMCAEEEWRNALPYEHLPGPSKWGFAFSFLPGGKFHNTSLLNLHRQLRKDYGDILKLPGQFGRRDIVLTFQPDNFQKIFRTEGFWPIRRGLDTIVYHRKKVRPEVYKDVGGLVAEQGEKWADFRTKVNPVMMQPKNVKFYVPMIDEVAKDFTKRITEIRNSETNEMPSNFETELNRWAFESIGVIALDTRLGLISDNSNPKTKKLFEALKVFFQLMYELDILPSMWKYVSTPKFKQYMTAMDTMTDIVGSYVQASIKRLEENKANKDPDRESVLEKLLKVDPHVAQIMAMDMLLAGVDTTSSTFVSVLYHLAKNPDKQQILREELIKILPNKDSPLTPESMKNMPYLRACMKEASRINPTAIGNFRATGQNLVLGGYQIPKGVDVAMGSWVLQLEDGNYPEAKKFIPERWLKSEEQRDGCPSAKSAHPFIFLPFGFGPRMCIGRRFAELEVEVLICRLIRNFEARWENPELNFKSITINVPDSELKFKFSDVA